jgi:hypothetical protein
MPIPAPATQPAAVSHSTSPAVTPSPHIEFHISNRNSKLLETSVTPTKHSPGAVSNRNKNTRSCGSQFWLRNAAHASKICARTQLRVIACRAGCSPTTPKICRSLETVAGPLIQRRLPVVAGSPPSRSGRLLSVRHPAVNCARLRLTPAQPAPTGSPLQILNPGSLRPLVRFSARKRTACTAGYSTARPSSGQRPTSVLVTAGQRSALTRQRLTFLLTTPISNRHWMRLEIAVTHTKQTPDPFLIDTENALFSVVRAAPMWRSTSSSKSAFYEKV